MSLSRSQNDAENERRWAEEAELARLRRIEKAARAVLEYEWKDSDWNRPIPANQHVWLELESALSEGKSDE